MAQVSVQTNLRVLEEPDSKQSYWSNLCEPNAGKFHTVSAYLSCVLLVLNTYFLERELNMYLHK